MPRRSSRAGFGLLAAALAAAVSGCAHRDNGAAILKRSGLGALPRESVGLLALEVRSLRGLKAFDRWVEEMASAADRDPRYHDLRQRFGPDALDRVDRLGLAIVPLSDGRVSYGVVAEGRLDEEAMRRALGGEETLTILPGDGRPDLSVCSIRGGGLAFGPRVVLDVIRRNATRRGQGLEANEVMGGLLARVRPAAHVWGAVDYRTILNLSREAGASGAGPLPLAAGPVGGALVGLAFQGTIGAAVDLDLTGVAAGEADARRLTDAARGLAALGRMGAGADKNTPWIQVLDALSIDRRGSEVLVHLTLPPAALDALAEKSRAAAATIPEPASAAETPLPVPATRPPAAGPAPAPRRPPAVTPPAPAPSPAGTPPSAPSGARLP